MPRRQAGRYAEGGWAHTRDSRDSTPPPARTLQDVVHQRGLAGAQKPRDDRDGHLGGIAVLRHGVVKVI